MLNKTTIWGFDIYIYENKKFLAYDVVAHPGVYISMGAEGLMRPEPEFRNVINMHTAYADGVGAVLAAKVLNNDLLVKIPGCELWLEVLQHMPASRVAVWGASPSVNQLTIDKLAIEFPKHQWVYAENGYVSNTEFIVGNIIKAKPDLVILALGQPRQEFIADELFSSLPMARILPIGGALDVYVEKVRRAPDFMIRLNLEWAYRLWLEPARIRRQLVLPKFLWRLVLSKVKYF